MPRNTMRTAAGLLAAMAAGLRHSPGIVIDGGSEARAGSEDILVSSDDAVLSPAMIW